MINVIKLSILLVVMSCISCQSSSNSVDSKYTINYYNNKKELTMLASLFAENSKLCKLDYDSIVPENIKLNTGKTSIEDIRQIMKKSNITGIIRIDDEIRFYSTLQPNKTIDYGYSYLQNKPKENLDTIDKMNCKSNKNIYYRKIEYKWYVFGFCSPKEY